MKSTVNSRIKPKVNTGSFIAFLPVQQSVSIQALFFSAGFPVNIEIWN